MVSTGVKPRTADEGRGVEGERMVEGEVVDDGVDELLRKVRHWGEEQRRAGWLARVRLLITANR
jgi:hypothetical protein